MEFFTLLQQYGPLAGAVLFFIWRDWQRETRMTSSLTESTHWLTGRIEQLENENRKVILPLVKRSTKVIAHNTSVMLRLEAALEKKATGATDVGE